MEIKKIGINGFCYFNVIGNSVTLKFTSACVVFVMRSDHPDSYTGIIYADITGVKCTIYGIQASYVNNTLTLTENSNTSRFCIALIA